ncbi:MAG: hypothetical protein AAB552_00735 [Patescibacteria group bacterium]
MKKIFTIFTATFIMLLPFVAVHALSSEIHVTQDGKASISGAKLMQEVGSTFFARLYWGDAFIRFTIKTNSGTQFLRATGEKTTIAEMSVGDIVDAVGELEPGSNTLNLVASSVKNSSVQKEQSSLSGNVASVDFSRREFTLYSTARGPVTVVVATSTQFLKGTRTLDLEHLRKGDKVTEVAGDYNIATKILVARSVTTHLDMSQFKPRLFIGKLAEIPSGVGATSIKVIIDNITHTIILTDKTLIMRTNRGAVSLARFVAGDTIRIWGALREVDDLIVDAEVVRNMNL